MLDYYEILGVPRGASDEDIKKAYRALAKIHHPDRPGGDEAKFKKIAEANDILSDAVSKAEYDAGALAKPFSLKTKKESYLISYRVKSGDLTDLYRGSNTFAEEIAFKIVKDPANNDLISNEAKILTELFPPSQVEIKQYRYLPRYLESLKIVEGGKHKQVNIMTWLRNFHSLVQIREAFHDKLPMEHGVWMFNRILEGLHYVNKQKGIIHGALTPDHILVYSSGAEMDPYNHGAKLIDWSYAVPKGEKVKAISPQWKHLYAPEILAKKPVSGATDIYMAAKCIIYVLGGDLSNDSLPSSIPSYLARFLQGCTLKNQAARPQDVWELYEEFFVHMRSYYGPKKYVPFKLPTVS